MEQFYNLTTITVELGFLGDFVLLLLKTCSLYHEKLFIQKFNDISSQVFNNFSSASDIIEAGRGRFCFYRYECKVAWYKLDCCKVSIGQQAQCNRLAFRVLTQDRRIQGGHSTTRKLISSQIFRCIWEFLTLITFLLIFTLVLPQKKLGCAFQ